MYSRSDRQNFPLISFSFIILLLSVILDSVSSAVILYRSPPSSTGSPEMDSEELLKLDMGLAHCGSLNLREITILELQSALIRGEITSEKLVQCYINRIIGMNPYLNAVIEVNPDAIEIAKTLDEARRRHNFIVMHDFGPLYGIPVLIKDNICTDDKMETTAGSNALLGIKPKEEAEIVRKLRKAGAIILGKTNLSEFANFRGKKLPNGWSSRGNHTKNAYILSEDPDGSSSGSAVAVAANLVPVAIGSETDGSIIAPAAKASIVGLKTSLGRVSTEGVIPLSKSQDVLGPMTRTVADAAIMFNVLTDKKFQNKCFDSKTLFGQCSKNYKVGILREPNWTLNESAPILHKLEKILKILKSIRDITVIDPVDAAPGTENVTTSESEITVFKHEFKFGINEYLKLKVKSNRNIYQNSVNTISTLNDIIKFNTMFNESNYNQDILIDSSETDGLENRTYIAEKEKNVAGAKLYLNYIFTKYDLDVIFVPSNNGSTTLPAVSGYPHITIPGGIGDDNIPFGVSFYGQLNSEETLLQISSKLEKELGKYDYGRMPPKFLP